MDLSKMSSADLRNLQEQLKRELKQRESHDRAAALKEIAAIADTVGVPLKDLVAGFGAGANAGNSGSGSGGGGSGGKGRGGRTGSVAPRYRNPADVTQQWTGRGRQPKWVKEWVDGGQDIAGLKV